MIRTLLRRPRHIRLPSSAPTSASTSLAATRSPLPLPRLAASPLASGSRGVKSSSRQHDPQSTIVPAPLHWGSHENDTESMPTELEIPPSKRAENAKPREGHAVISTFDLFSIGVGPSSSHTVGPMRAAKIFTYSLPPAMFDKIAHLKVSLHGSLAATGMGHMTPHAVLLGMMGEDPETVEVGRLSRVMDEVRAVGQLDLGLDGGHKRVKFDLEKDLTWHLNPLPSHPNGMVFTVFDDEGNMLATNEYFSIGGGFVVNGETQLDENMYYMQTRPRAANEWRRGVHEDDAEGTEASADSGKALPGPEEKGGVPEPTKREAKVAEHHDPKPPYLFASAEELYTICKKHNLTIAQVVWENERAFRSDDEIASGLLRLWQVMDECIRNGVTSTDKTLPGGLEVRRRAPGLYKRLQQGFYPAMAIPKPGGGEELGVSTREERIGRTDHPLQLVPKHTRPVFPGIEYLSCMAIAVNEVNASGGRVVTAPTNGAAGVIPATLKYLVEYHSQQPERDVMTFLLTAAAIGMLFKRGATISAAEGGCMAEVGVACSMAAAGLAATLGAEPAVILQAAEIGIEHNLGLTCDPLGGLVQIPCIERNSLGAVKAVTAAQLAMAGGGEHTVSLDDAIEACRTTALDMHSHYKETSLGGLATATGVTKIPVSSPAC